MIFQGIKVAFFLYVISIGGMYYLSSRSKGPVVIPGDIYVVKGSKRIYIPLASSLLLTIVLYLALKFVSTKFVFN